MKIAFVVFDGITWLDLVGVYEPVSKLKSLGYITDMTWDFCSFTQTAADYGGFRILPTKIKNDLGNYDVIIVPGGKGTRELMNDEGFMTWLRKASQVKQKVSVCTGNQCH